MATTSTAAAAAATTSTSAAAAVTTTSAAAAASTSTSAAASTTSAAAATTATSAAAATTSTAAAASSTSAAASTSSASAAVSSSTSAAASSSTTSSAAATTTSSSSSSSTSSTSATSSLTSSSSTATSTSTAGLLSSTDSSGSTTSSSHKLSSGAIGGIVGGVGGVALLLLAFWLYRRHKAKQRDRELYPPPPPRDMMQRSGTQSSLNALGAAGAVGGQKRRTSSYGDFKPTATTPGYRDSLYAPSLPAHYPSYSRGMSSSRPPSMMFNSTSYGDLEGGHAGLTPQEMPLGLSFPSPTFHADEQEGDFSSPDVSGRNSPLPPPQVLRPRGSNGELMTEANMEMPPRPSTPTGSDFDGSVVSSDGQRQNRASLPPIRTAGLNDMPSGQPSYQPGPGMPRSTSRQSVHSMHSMSSQHMLPPIPHSPSIGHYAGSGTPHGGRRVNLSMPKPLDSSTKMEGYLGGGQQNPYGAAGEFGGYLNPYYSQTTRGRGRDRERDANARRSLGNMSSYMGQGSPLGPGGDLRRESSDAELASLNYPNAYGQRARHMHHASSASNSSVGRSAGDSTSLPSRSGSGSAGSGGPPSDVDSEGRKLVNEGQ